MNDGGPAFPFSRQWENERKGYTEHEYGDGMTLRDYFAGQALAGLAREYHIESRIPENVAQDAYTLADAMLKAREVK